MPRETNEVRASIELEFSPDPTKIIEWVTEAYRETEKLLQEIGIRG